MSLDKQLQQDIQVKALNKSFTIIGGLGQVNIEPKTNVYTLDELLKLHLIQRTPCAFYSVKDNLTFYCFTDYKKYQIIQICDGDVEKLRHQR